MDSSNHRAAPSASGIGATVAEARDRIQASVDRVLSALEESINETLSQSRAEAERSAAFARESARRETTESLNAVVRHLKQASTRELWARTLLDAATAYCTVTALFRIRESRVLLEGVRGVEGVVELDLPLESAPAFSGAAESGDTVVAAATARELSPEIAGILAPSAQARVYLFPVIKGTGTPAVLCASPDESGALDVAGLELLAAIAGPWIPEPAEQLVKPEAAPQLVTITSGAPPTPGPARKPAWSELSTSDRELHLKAQRYARTRVAEILLRSGDRVRQGRAARNLYSTVKEEIDSGREAFREQFVEPCSSMVDYFHLELAGTLAKGDPGLLGPGYPGPLH